MSILVVIAIEAIAQVLIGRYVLDAGFPGLTRRAGGRARSRGRAFSALGLATTAVVRSSEGSSAIVNAIYLPMIFISGVFFSVDALPGFLEAIADVLPLTYLLDLIRSVFVDGDDLASSWRAILVVALWGIAGALLAMRSFRWEPQEG